MQKDGTEQAEALRIAIDTEKIGYRFYRMAAARTANPAGRAVFEQLGKDEMDHIRALTALYGAIVGGEPWMTYREAIEKRGPTPADETVFPGNPDGTTEGFNDVEALREALRIEEDAVKFYSERAARTQDDRAKSFYNSLVRMEEGHAKIVQAEIDSLTGTGFWMDYQEISLED